MQQIQVEREARRLLPHMLAEFLRRPEDAIAPTRHGDVDLEFSDGDRVWVAEVKSSSSPGVVDLAAQQIDRLRKGRGEDAICVLVVPYMTPGGAKAAEVHDLNWIDLSGNARVSEEGLRIWIQGRPNRFAGRGRPASAFAPKSSRIARTLLLEPSRWWRQTQLAEATDLDAGRVSRVVNRLEGDGLLERRGQQLRPRDPDLLLDAWSDDYRLDRHDIVLGHYAGNGIEMARELNSSWSEVDQHCAFTGLAAAWLHDGFAQFRMVSVYVSGDPRSVADAVGIRRNERGANVQIIGPNDRGVFDGESIVDGLPCVSPVQTYLDLLHLPERAADAAEHLRRSKGLWHG